MSSSFCSTFSLHAVARRCSSFNPATPCTPLLLLLTRAGGDLLLKTTGERKKKKKGGGDVLVLLKTTGGDVPPISPLHLVCSSQLLESLPLSNIFTTFLKFPASRNVLIARPV